MRLDNKMARAEPMDAMTPDHMPWLSPPIIICVSVGAFVICVLLVALVWRFACRGESRLYYKFEYYTGSFKTASDADTNRAIDTPSITDEKLDVADVHFVTAERNARGKQANARGKQAKAGKGTKNGSNEKDRTVMPVFASMEDGISAPRIKEHEVKSSGVAILDHHGRPIATPIC